VKPKKQQEIPKTLSNEEALLSLSKLGSEPNEKNFLQNHVTSSPDFKLNSSLAKSRSKLRTEYDGLEDVYKPIKRSMLGEP